MVAMMHLTKLASAQMILWNILESYNEDPAAVFKRVGLDIEKMRIPGARYNKEKIAKLWEETGRLIEDPCFGLAAATHWHPSYLGTLGYAMLASSSLRITLERLVRFFEIITSVNAGELIEDEQYFWTVSRYIHMNLVRGKRPLVTRPEQWPWSS